MGPLYLGEKRVVLTFIMEIAGVFVLKKILETQLIELDDHFGKKLHFEMGNGAEINKFKNNETMRTFVLTKSLKHISGQY